MRDENTRLAVAAQRKEQAVVSKKQRNHVDSPQGAKEAHQH